jgi:hypothetical protein
MRDADLFHNFLAEPALDLQGKLRVAHVPAELCIKLAQRDRNVAQPPLSFFSHDNGTVHSCHATLHGLRARSSELELPHRVDFERELRQVIFASQNIAPLQAPPSHSASCSSICIRLILHHDRFLPQGCNSNVNMTHNLIADGLELGRNRRNPSLQSYTGMNRSHGAHNGQDMQASAYYHEGSKLNLNQKRRSVPPNTFENLADPHVSSSRLCKKRITMSFVYGARDSGIRISIGLPITCGRIRIRIRPADRKPQSLPYR